MILKLRQRMAQDQSGFTLVELLVVMLILGLLAAIAIPAFFNQTDKARDASAKSAADRKETAMETYATDNNGVYTGANAAALQNEESTLNGATISTVAVPAGGGDASNKSYKVSVTSSTGNIFSVTRHDHGTTTLTGTTAGTAGCPTGGSWG